VSEALHVILGMDPEEWEMAMDLGRSTPGWSGMPADAEPRYHAHPALGIIGHSHSQTEEARRPHVHRPVVGWDHKPIFVATQDSPT
jgi:hypothetical protein